MKNPRFLISLWTCPHSKNITKLNEYCKAFQSSELEKDNKERKFVCRKVADTALECTEEVVAPRLLEDHRGKLQKTPPLSL
ncbi:unnamed protein product [Lepeophtheirus salmonis]|uniref:(salmon louse) hypothetical protein n=1 Tax=Lepeophtheirus salmonis TaxID=72036 RepID=A0A7R8CWN3_LEPSM|nr:unnamed protein product [Lepeophtheirus salmonis]CAF2954531.1 unnamed protein product [Lepeophtheirus salmonis]